MFFSQLGYKAQKRILIGLFLVLPITLLVTFSFLPLVNLVRYSFTDYNGYSTKRMLNVGFQNYIDLFTNPEHFTVFKVCLYYLAGAFIQTILALYFATILSFKVRFKNLFKGALFFPYLLNTVVVSFIFLNAYRPGGTVDSVMKLLGLGKYIHYWLRDPGIINISLVFVSIWKYFGLSFIIFLGAIQSVSPELYEAAEIDGANKWQQFRFIILPSIRKVLELLVILAVSGSISVYEIPKIITDGGNGSMTFVMDSVNQAFNYRHFGFASAMGTVLFVIVVIVTLIQKMIFKEREA